MKMLRENVIYIYPDGSMFSRPRSGGIGIRLVIIDSLGGEEIQDVPIPGYAGATNNQMELYGCIKGIQEAMNHPRFYSSNRIVIKTDSQYVVSNHTKAFYDWSKKGWRNYDGRPIANAEIWKELLRIIRKTRKSVEFEWVNAKDEHHRKADKLARKSAKNVINPPLNVVKVRRKLSPKSVDSGCIPMENQRISIRIITDELLKLQRCYKYKYEVISRSSPYYRNVDFVFSGILLNAGHCYSVRFNDNQKYPMIIKMFREIPKIK